MSNKGIPVVDEAIKILRKAEQMNPGSWINHSIKSSPNEEITDK